MVSRIYVPFDSYTYWVVGFINKDFRFSVSIIVEFRQLQQRVLAPPTKRIQTVK